MAGAPAEEKIGHPLILGSRLRSWSRTERSWSIGRGLEGDYPSSSLLSETDMDGDILACMHKVNGFELDCTDLGIREPVQQRSSRG